VINSLITSPGASHKIKFAMRILWRWKTMQCVKGNNE